MASSTGRAFFNVFPHFPWWLPTLCCSAAALVKIFRNIEGVVPKGPSAVRIPTSLDNSVREGISGPGRSRINQGSSQLLLSDVIIRLYESKRNSDVYCVWSFSYPSWWFPQLSPKTRTGKITILMEKGYLQETYNEAFGWFIVSAGLDNILPVSRAEKAKREVIDAVPSLK